LVVHIDVPQKSCIDQLESTGFRPFFEGSLKDLTARVSGSIGIAPSADVRRDGMVSLSEFDDRDAQVRANRLAHVIGGRP
jgi:hypothetical protein